MTAGILGLAGVVLGVIITWIGNYLSESWRRQRAAKYLAVRVVCILDSYEDKCVEVGHDDGHSGGERDEYLQVQVPSPEPPSYPAEIDWTAIDPELMYRIISLPTMAERAEQDIRNVFEIVSTPPDYEEGFEARQSGYNKLGKEAQLIASYLRKQYGIPKRALISQQ